MKTYLFILTLIGLSTLTTQAQDDRKVRNDVTYSINNYKHPNKAAAAMKWANPKGVPVAAPKAVSGPIANYKQQIPGTEPTGGVVASHTSQPDIYRNYKIQRVNLPKSTTPSPTEGSQTSPERIDAPSIPVDSQENR